MKNKLNFSIVVAASLALAGCGTSQPESQEDNAAVVNEVENTTAADTAEGASENAADPEVAQEAAADDPFPYTAVLTCGMNGFENINLMACLGGDVGTEIEINNGGNYGMYKVYNLPSEWKTTDRGVEIPLARNFSIKMQNSDETLIMGLRIFDSKNNVVFQKQASQYGVISVNN